MMSDLTRRTAAELADALAAGETSSVEVTQAHLDRIAAVDGARARLPARRRRRRARRGPRPPTSAARAGAAGSALDGVPIAVKDVLATEGLPTTCGSQILEGWMPPYDATVVARLRAAGLPILGKTNMDEFAMGSSTEHSAYGPTHNPWDLDRIPGGSGGGSAAAVAAFEAPLAIGTDTGGSIRQPGAVTGTVGVKPTYGGVSRYGLVALANSLDQAGPVTRTVLDAALLHEVIGGHDPLDSTSRRPARCRPSSPPPARARPATSRGLRIGVVKELDRRGLPGRRRSSASTRRCELLVDAGAEVVEVSCPTFVYALAAYYLILPAEASSNLAKFDAMRYGLRVLPDGKDSPSAEEVMRATRDAGLRRRGQAPHHPRHLRAVQRLLRRLLRPGAEGPHADQPRLRRGLREGRRAALADRADHGVPARREARRPGGDVPQRPRHHPGQPRRRPGHLGARRPRRRGRPARPASRCSPRRWPTTGSTASAPRSRRCSTDRWGGPLLDQAPALQEVTA